MLELECDARVIGLDHRVAARSDELFLFILEQLHDRRFAIADNVERNPFISGDDLVIKDDYSIIFAIDGLLDQDDAVLFEYSAKSSVEFILIMDERDTDALAAAIGFDDDGEAELGRVAECIVDLATCGADGFGPGIAIESLAAGHDGVVHGFHEEIGIVLVAGDLGAAHRVQVEGVVAEIALASALELDLADHLPFRFQKYSRPDARSDLL